MKGRGALPPLAAPFMDWRPQTQAEVHPYWRVSLRSRGVLSTPGLKFVQVPLQLLALPNGLEEQRGGGRGDIERVDPAPLRKRNKPVASRGNAGSQPLALPA
jgi:hypothetical protein